MRWLSLDRPAVHSRLMPPRIDPDHAVLDASLHALGAAVTRALDGGSRPDPLGSFAALSECIWWALACDEQLCHAGRRRYRAARDADPDGRLMRAVNWVGGRLDPAPTMVLVAGPVGAMTTDAYQVVWRRADDVPVGPGKSRRQHPFGREEYRARLEGRPVDATVHALWRWFAAQRSPESDPQPTGGLDLRPNGNDHRQASQVT